MSGVIEAIANVKRDLGAVSKGKEMVAGPARYSYRAIDDVLNKLHQPMVDHGIIFVPTVLQVIEETRGQTRSGATQTYTRVEVSYTVAHVDGSNVTAVVAGQALDTSDKGLNKAFTAAFKVMLQQVFAIPFATDDPDDHYPENPLRRAEEAPGGRSVPEPPADAGDGRLGAIQGKVAAAIEALSPQERSALWAALKRINVPAVPASADDANTILALVRQVRREHKQSDQRP